MPERQTQWLTGCTLRCTNGQVLWVGFGLNSR